MQKSEAFCDDVNLLTEHLDGFLVVENVVNKFEMTSGAIVSRNRKCKVIGFGAWHGKEDWPLAWIEPVKSHKVFGIIIANNYRDILKLNWAHRYQKFSNTIYSWNSRFLDTVFQRVEVLRLFALSRVYYVAAILPIEKSMVKKFECLMGNFIWKHSGKLLRVSLADIKNTKLSGGLDLPCIEKMANALLLSQCLRTIKSISIN